MMPYCSHQNWLQRLLGRHCWRVAKHVHVGDDMVQWASCDKRRHYKWYCEKIGRHI